MSRLFLSLIWLCAGLGVQAQDSVTSLDESTVPEVFLLGQHQESYASLSDTYGTSLLAVAGNDMNSAYDRWLHMLLEMEDLSKTLNVDLRGVRLWIHVYWAENGKIDHIAYFPKPHSRQISDVDLSAFFAAFTKQYTMPVSTAVPFSHYGSAGFPLATK